MTSTKDLEGNRGSCHSSLEDDNQEVSPAEIVNESATVASVKTATQLPEATTSSSSSFSIWSGFERFGSSVLTSIENIGESIASMLGFTEHNFDDVLEDLTEEEREQIEENLVNVDETMLMEKIIHFASPSPSSSSYAVDNVDKLKI